MMTRTLVIAVTVLVLATGSAFAQMSGGNMGSPMPGPGPGPGPNPGSGYGCGNGYGMGGVGGMISGMMGNTLADGYLDSLNPITTPEEARAEIQGFIDQANSGLKISEIWEYGTVYKAELSDTKGAKAFDLMLDKFTRAVSPEMGMSMMLNASYGKAMYKTSSFGKNLALTPQQATDIAQKFLDNNKTVLVGYILGTPEIYPGYYKFHTKLGPGINDFGMDIMVNGYNEEIWMNTFLGLPINKY
jgi:hypothetical protein